MNHKDKALQVLEENNKTTKDIKWVGFPYHGYYDSLEDYYNSGIGDYDCSSYYIPGTIVIVGDDWWLELWSDPEPYPGGQCSGWEFRTFPKKPEEKISANES